MAPSNYSLDDLSKRDFIGSKFLLVLDGTPSTAYVASVEGGLAKRALVDEAIGTSHERIKHVSVAEIDPINVELGLAATDDILKWIRGAWKQEWSRHSGAIVHGDAQGQTRFYQEFQQALLTEVTFPSLDLNNPKEATIKLKVQPETASFQRDKAYKIGAEFPQQQKLFRTNQFRLELDGINLHDGVQKIDGLAIRQGVKMLHTGRDTFPEIEPTKVEFPDISVHMSMGRADGVIDWYDKFVTKGKRDPSSERSGAIEFLGPTGAPLLRVPLKNVGIRSLSAGRTDPSAKDIKTVKFDLYIGSLEVERG